MEALKAEWLHFFTSEQESDSWWVRKKKLCEQRNVDMVRIQGEGRMYRVIRYDHYTLCEYLLHITFVMKQNDNDFYIEEQVLPIECRMEDGNIVEHKIKPFIKDKERQSDAPSLREFKMPLYNPRFSYDRRAAVQYAERWWNSYNPVFRQFSVDCTNYVSQCLLAGGAPMRGAPNRNKGWWYQHNEWSYSWSVAHSMRWYLSGSNEGLKGKEVELAEDLNPGDVICYDFQGDDRWDHTTIVVSKDANNMPLVNAHTDNSRHRYWTYEDSTAWTPNIKYKFFQVGQ